MIILQEWNSNERLSKDSFFKNHWSLKGKATLGSQLAQKVETGKNNFLQWEVLLSCSDVVVLKIYLLVYLFILGVYTVVK